MSGQREILELGVFGRVPVDTLFQLYIETIRGDILTIYQTRCQASLGGWVCDLAIQKSTIFFIIIRGARRIFCRGCKAGAIAPIFFLLCVDAVLYTRSHCK